MLKIEIDGNWKLTEFAEFFRGMQDLIDHSNFGQKPKDTYVEGVFEEGVFVAELPSVNINVLRIHFGSQGFTDLAGAAASLEQIRLFVQYLIDLWIHKNDRKLDRKDRELDQKARALEIERLRQEVAAKYLDERSNERQAIEGGAADPLIKAVIDGRITGVRLANDLEPDLGLGI